VTPERFTVGGATAATPGGVLLGFVTFRHGVRIDRSTIYEIATNPMATRRGVGSALFRFVADSSPHGVVRLKVMAANSDGRRAFDRMGFAEIDRAVAGRLRTPMIVLEWRRNALSDS
jgi:ribosomal protein S18 acetylase RimI-like enzyme